MKGAARANARAAVRPISLSAGIRPLRIAREKICLARVGGRLPDAGRLSAASEVAGSSDGDGDVYVVDSKPLAEGRKKHTVLVFVSDESGIINRVSGVFSRRGVNMESLAVGLNVDKALFTIVMNTTDQAASNVVKQISKLVKVKFVQDITARERVERELMLIKVNAPSGAKRTEVLQVAEIFRAKVVDLSENTITLSASGDPGKTFALQSTLDKFGVVQVARTGKIALQRGELTIQSQGNTGAAGVPERGEARGARGAEQEAREALGEEGDRRAGVEEVPREQGSGVGDVYRLDDEDASPEVWTVGFMSESPEELPSAGGEEIDRHVMSLLVVDEPGVLQQVTSVFARRGYNLQSLAVGPAERKGISRISLVVPGTKQSVSNLAKQLLKLVYVKDVTDLTELPYCSRELMLVKVQYKSSKQRRNIIDLADIFRANTCDISPTTITLEIQGKTEKMLALQRMLDPFVVLEVARTGRVALPRESGVDTKYLESREFSSSVMSVDDF